MRRRGLRSQVLPTARSFPRRKCSCPQQDSGSSALADLMLKRHKRKPRALFPAPRAEGCRRAPQGFSPCLRATPGIATLFFTV